MQPACTTRRAACLSCCRKERTALSWTSRPVCYGKRVAIMGPRPHGVTGIKAAGPLHAPFAARDAFKSLHREISVVAEFVRIPINSSIRRNSHEFRYPRIFDQQLVDLTPRHSTTRRAVLTRKRDRWPTARNRRAFEGRIRGGVSLSPVFKGDWWSWRTLCSRNPIPRSHHEREKRTLWTPFRPG